MAAGFGFGEALVRLRAGVLVRRRSWLDPRVAVLLVGGGTLTAGGAPEGFAGRLVEAHLVLRTAGGLLAPWASSSGDLLAEDWMEERRAEARLEAGPTLVGDSEPPRMGQDWTGMRSQARAAAAQLGVVGVVATALRRLETVRARCQGDSVFAQEVAPFLREIMDGAVPALDDGGEVLVRSGVRWMRVTATEVVLGSDQWPGVKRLALSGVP